MPEDFESPSKPPEPSKSLPVIGGLGKLLNRFRQEKASDVEKEPEVITGTDIPTEILPVEEIKEEIKPDIISRDARRQRLKEEYTAQRGSSSEEVTPPRVEIQVANESSPVTIPRKLPDAFESVESPPGLKFEPTLENMPWVQAWLKEPNAELSVNLAKITLRGTNEQFYFGSFIRGDELIKAAEQLDSHRKQIADALFYAHIPDIIKQGYSHNAKLIDHNNSDQPIFYFGNKSGQRVYFMRFQLNNIPVIIRVAVCDKVNQERVYSQLTTDTFKMIKRKGRL